jgi:hypothetical protein
VICFVVAALQVIAFFGIFKVRTRPSEVGGIYRNNGKGRALTSFLLDGSQEKTRLFRAYAILNAVAFACAFIVAAVLIIISAIHHKSAVAKCEVSRNLISSQGNPPGPYLAEKPTPRWTQQTYFTGVANTTETSSATSGEGAALCEAFAWADVGIMGGLWVLLFVVQTYLIL